MLALCLAGYLRLWAAVDANNRSLARSLLPARPARADQWRYILPRDRLTAYPQTASSDRQPSAAVSTAVPVTISAEE